MKSLLVTGTDTGVGKTLVGCALARALSKRMRVAPFKPVETGCREVGGRLSPEDAERLSEAAASTASLDLVCPYRYREPLAPWIAAERAGRPIDRRRILECFQTLARDADLVLVETAGGLLVPLAVDYGYADLAREIGARVLVVVGNRLGAINQTLLTLECAERRGLPVVGYVLNQLAPETDLAQATNARALAALSRSPCLASIPYLSERESLARIGELLAARLGFRS